MPPRRPPADPNKKNPTGVRKAGAGKRWKLQGTVGNFDADRVKSKPDTTVLTKQEIAAGATKLDRSTRFDYAKGTVETVVDAGTQTTIGGGKQQGGNP